MATATATWEGAFLQDNFNIEYDFDPDDTIRKAVHNQLSQVHPMLDDVRSVYVQRFQLCYQQMFYGIVSYAMCPYAPTAIPPFQIEGDDSFCYFITYSKGIPFDPAEDKDGRTLYEYSDRGQKMFLSQTYKKIIKDIFAAALFYIRYVPRLRCGIQLKTLYIDKHLNDPFYQVETYDMSDPDLEDYLLPNVHFMKFSVLDEGVQDDIASVCQQLRDLFHEINTKSNIAGAPQQEFQLFMDSLELQYGCVRNIYKNVVFASKAHRVKLMACFAKHFFSKNFSKEEKGNHDYLVRSVFGEEWESKLKRHPKLKIFYPKESLGGKEDEQDKDKNNKRQRRLVDDITTCITGIKNLYFAYENDKRQYSAKINSIEELVEIMHCIFPYHIAALTKMACEEGMPLPEFEPLLMDCKMDENPNEISYARSVYSSDCWGDDGSEGESDGSPMSLVDVDLTWRPDRMVTNKAPVQSE